MLQFDKLTVNERQIVQKACSFLFTPEKAANSKFLNTLSKTDIKSAYRMKARMFHPDMLRKQDDELILRRQERFLNIQSSYEALVSIFPKEEKPVIWKKSKKVKKIIAVGGAKGGIGKSVFAANLGVVLSSMGKKTVVADFDLGGANLHLYLGKTRIKKSINDFLAKKTSNIEDLLIQSEYGPLILGGDSSKLGSANIHYTQKLKLIKAVQQIDTEYLVIDLGGDTSFNMIDFFNIADTRIVMTTCEPASYLDGYNFIKVSLYRKLTRLFSDDNQTKNRRDKEIEKMIRTSLSGTGKKEGSIENLINKIAGKYPEKRGVIKSVLNQFKPVLVINKSSEEGRDASEVAKRIKEVSEKKLSIDVNVSAPVFFNKQTEESTRELIPVTAKYKNGYMKDRIEEFIDKTIL